MISPLVIEREGRWRPLATVAILCIALLPVAWLVFGSLAGHLASAALEIQRGPFGQALMRSLKQGLCVAFFSFIVGWPCGSLLGLTKFPGKRLVCTLLLLPLLMPTFLWAIGLASLRSLFPYKLQSWLDGLSGCVLTFTTFALPLVIFSATLRLRGLSRAHLDTLRLLGGAPLLLRTAARYAWPAAFSAAVLGGVLTLADSGPGQIMGYHGAASDILIAFAARQDAALAAAKAIMLGAVLLPIAFPIAWGLARSMESELLGKDLEDGSLIRPRAGLVALLFPFAIAALVLILAPIGGLVKPMLSGPAHEAFIYATDALRDSAGTTVFYGLTAGITATLFGFAISLCASRSKSYRRAVFIISFVSLALPPSIHALGIVQLVTSAPPSLDFLLRSRWIVGLGLGLRFLPIAAILCLFGWSRFPRSLTYAAAVHGIPLRVYICRVIFPGLLPALIVSTLIVLLLSLADVSSTLLLQPPGATAFPGRIFAVMDNASERHVAALCIVYMIASAVVMTPITFLIQRLKFQPMPADDSIARA